MTPISLRFVYLILVYLSIDFDYAMCEKQLILFVLFIFKIHSGIAELRLYIYIYIYLTMSEKTEPKSRGLFTFYEPKYAHMSSQ